MFVWLKKLTNANKLSANFEPNDFKVIDRIGSELVVENIATGVQYRRNVTHAKLRPPDQLNEAMNDPKLKRALDSTISPTKERPKRQCAKSVKYSA